MCSGVYSSHSTVLVAGLGGDTIVVMYRVVRLGACSAGNSENEDLCSDKRSWNRGKNAGYRRVFFH